MNIIKKIYCRAYQFVFKCALPVLPYKDPKILKSICEVQPLLNEINLSKPLIVTDGQIRELGLTKPLERDLQKAGKTAVVYDKTEQNPTTDMVYAALKLYRENDCDCIIAFGGGSPMDCAKAVGAMVARPGKPLKKMAGVLKVHKKLPTIIAVPTTAGTGSETTLACVIVDSSTRHKYVINDFPLIPKYAVLDPSVIHSLPHHIAAATGMDALTHAIEAYIGNSTTKHTREDAKKAVKLIFENIKQASAHESREAEAAMLSAAHYAGRAFTRSYVGYIHALSHALSGKYNLPHGETNAILLPIVLREYGKSAHKKLNELAECVGISGAEEFIEAIAALNRELNIPEKISSINEEDIPELVKHADKEANPLYPVPVLWGRKELAAIYKKAACNVISRKKAA